MTGVIGVIAPDEPGFIEASLSGISKSILHQENEIFQTYTNHIIGICQTQLSETEEPSAIIRQGNIVLSLYGYVALDRTLQDRIQSVPTIQRGQPINQMLIELYQACGPQALTGLNGQYVLVVWNDDDKTLHIINDRYGIQPFYLWQSGTRLVFGSTLRGIARYPGFQRQLNPTALFDLLATGQMLGEHTLFQDVQALPPASWLRYGNGQYRLTRYWQPALYQPDDQTLKFSGAVERLGELIHQAVDTHVPPDSCLLLTGGLDSRWLAGAMADRFAPQQMTACTLGHRQAQDAILAQKIAQVAGINHCVIPINPNFLGDYSAECVRRSEGNMNCTAGWILGESSYLRSHGVRSVVTGVGAELISGRHWIAEQPVADLKNGLMLLTSQYWHFEQAAGLMRAPYRADAPWASLDLLERCLNEAPSSDLISRFDYLHMVQHRRHPTGNILAADSAVREPFFDNDLVDYAFLTPPRMRAMFYKKALSLRYPRLASITTTEHGLSVTDELNEKKNPSRFFRDTLFRTVRRLNLPTAKGMPIGDAPWNTIYPNHWMRTTSREFIIQQTLKKIDLLEPWVNGAAARQLIENHLAGKVHAYAMVGALLTAVLWVDLNL